MAAAAICALSGCETHDHRTYDDHYAQAFTIIAAIVILCFVLGKYTNMLRAEVSDCEQFDANAEGYSYQ